MDETARAREGEELHSLMVGGEGKGQERGQKRCVRGVQDGVTVPRLHLHLQCFDRVTAERWISERGMREGKKIENSNQGRINILNQ